MKKFFRITYYSGIAIVFLLVVLVGYTQTRGFRSSLQDYILSHYHAVLNGNLIIGRIEGNLITGIRLYDVELRNLDSSSLATANRVDLSYDPLALFFKRVSLGRISVLDPHVQLVRSASGRWNVSNLFFPSSDTAASAWSISAKNLELNNASVTLIDSVLINERVLGLRPPPPRGTVDYADVTLDSLNVEGGLQIKPSQEDLQLRLLSFTVKNPGIHLRHLQGNFKLSKNEVAATQVHLETDRSRLNLDVSLSQLDITRLKSLEELKTKPVRLDLAADKLDARELKQFLYPWVDFLDQDLALEVRAGGEFGRLDVQKVLVETPESKIAISGVISNLHKPKDLEMDLAAANSVIDPDDISAHVPGLALPELGQLGRTRFRLKFDGTPTNFESSVRASTQTGTVDVHGQLRIGDVLEYKTSFVTSDFDLGKLFDNSDLESSLAMNGTLTGIGTDLRTASAVARIEVDSSQFWGMPLEQSVFVLDLNNAILRAHTQLHARSTVYELSSVLNFSQGDSVSFTLNGSVNAMNLADIIRNDQFSSDLSFMLKASGSGKAVNRFNSTATISFLHSSFGEVPFEKGDIGLSYDLSQSQRSRFTLRSEPVDLNVEGHFTLPALVENIIDGEKIVSDAISHRFRTLDSLQGVSPSPRNNVRFQVLPDRHPKDVDLAYRLEARNLYPVGVFFQKVLSGSLFAKGAMRGNVDSLDFDSDARIQSFGYRNRTDSYTMRNGNLALDLKHISRTGLLSVLETDLNLQSDNFSVNNLAFFKTSLELHSQKDSASYQWSASIDSTYQVDVRGTSVFASNVYALNLAELRLGMDFYILENNDPVEAKLGRDGVYIDNLLLSHEVEELGISGYFNPAGRSDLNISVKDFLLNNLRSILKRTKLADPVRDLNGILNVSLKLKGSMNDPEMSLDLTANGFRSRDVVFGQIVAKSSYTDHLLSLFIELRNRQNEPESKPDLLISGTVPYEFGSARDQSQKPKGEMNLTLFSKGLNMQFLDPFLPVVSNVTGILVCDMKVRGNVDAPTYEGSISLQSTKFFFKPLGLYLTVQGKLIPNGTRVGFENFLVRNIPEDRSDGQLKLSGSFSLAGLTLRDFDLRADGQLLVMKESSRLAGQKFYGDLFLGTGSDGIQWRGRPSDSKVTGDILIKRGNITFPPERETTSLTNTAINVVFKDDTSKVTKPAEGKEQTSVPISETSNQYALVGTVPDAAGPPAVSDAPSPDPLNAESGSKSFVDNISYDLDIDVQSPTSLLFVFNPQPREELFADLKGRLAFFKSAEQTRLTGEVSLENRSYYYFFKRFDASGKIDFRGDPVNPELDVTAKYEGIHSIDTLAAKAGNAAGSGPNPGYVAPKTANGQLLTSERVDVLLQITGTKNKPKTKFDLEFPDRDKNSQYVSKDPDADAMSFLVTGYLKDELDPQQRGSFLTANVLSSLTSGLITGPLTNALKQQIGAIQSVDLQYYGGDWNKTDVRVTAAISSAVIRLGGRVIEGINNTNVSVEVPVGSVFGSDRWRNLLFKYERKVDAVESIDQRTQSNSLSLFYRIVF